MKKTILGILGFIGFSLIAQEGNLNTKVLFTVEEDIVTAEEYLAVYNKNRDVGQEIDPKTPSEYLELYINFKLKVHEAKALGRDTLPSFLREYRGYRNQLAQPYLSDNNVTDELVEEAYLRQKYDVRASHIMSKLPKNPSPTDTLKAYKEIVRLKQELDNGADFATLARVNSDDTYSAKRGGDLGFFTVFNMVYPFESAAYNTELGTVSNPIRSEFGYHLVKPTEKRDARGEITVAHILLLDKKGNEEMAQNNDERINEIYEKLKLGEDFGKLVSQYSDDKGSALKKGLLPSFGINKMYPEFEDAAFALKDSGDFSAPVKTPIGWHIIQLVKAPEKITYEQSKDRLKTRVQKDARGLESKESTIRKIKREYNFKEYPSRYKLAFDQVDDSFIQSNYKVDKVKHADKVLVEFADKSYSIHDFLNYLEENQRKYKGLSKKEAKLYNAVADFGEAKLLAYEKSRLHLKYPEFRLLDREYYEGILLFDLTDELVWRKAMSDTVGLESYYEANKENYKWDERYKGFYIDAESEKVAKKANKYLAKGKSTEFINSKLNKNSKLSVSIVEDTFVKGDLDFLKDNPISSTGASAIVEQTERFKALYVNQIIEPTVKPLDETRGKVISDYQNYLEKEWIKELSQKYEVKVNNEVLQKVIEKLESES